MFNNLRNKWNVGWLQLTLIIITFAVGGSLCGLAARNLLRLLSIENNWLYAILYIIIVTLLWPLCVLLISFPLGQFRFFRNYIFKLYSQIAGKKRQQV